MRPHTALDLPEESTRADVARLMRPFTIETTPGNACRVPDFRSHLAEGTWVYITSLPGSDFSGTVETCRKLTDQGMTPVPHLAARGIADSGELDERLKRMTSEAGVTRVLTIAGSDREAAGSFTDTLSMLETGLFEKYEIRSIGVAGHPEHAPGLDRARLQEHEARKLEFARKSGIEMYMLTQFVFDARPVIDFVERIRSQGNELPVVVGLPGLATVQSLLRYAKACGIGPSTQFLMRRARDLHKLLSVQAPDKLVLDIASYRAANADCGITGAHLYPFGAFEKSATWANAVVAGKFKLNRSGFMVADRHASTDR